MRWVIRGIFLLLLAFAAAVIGGAFIDPTLYVERTAKLRVPDYVAYPWANDLTKAHSWSPWYLADINAEVAFSGPPEGVGQSVAWRSDIIGIGTQGIVDSQQDALVRSHVSFAGEEGDFIIAFQPADDGGSHVLMSYETSVGGFPYFQRLMKPLTIRSLEVDFDQSLDVLAELVLTDTTEFE